MNQITLTHPQLRSLSEAELERLNNEYEGLDPVIVLCTACGMKTNRADVDSDGICTDCNEAEAKDISLADYWREQGVVVRPDRLRRGK